VASLIGTENLVAENRKSQKLSFLYKTLSIACIEVTAELDGYDLLKATHVHHLPTHTIIYSFTHLTIQEFLCALYMLAMSVQEHQILKYFGDYPNVFVFLCGITGLASHVMSQFICYELTSVLNVATVVKCVYESQQTILGLVVQKRI